jgi:hypothetical protein
MFRKLIRTRVLMRMAIPMNDLGEVCWELLLAAMKLRCTKESSMLDLCCAFMIADAAWE